MLDKIPSKYHLEPNRDGIVYKRRERPGYDTQERFKVHKRNDIAIKNSPKSFVGGIIRDFSKKIDETPVSPVKIKALGFIQDENKKSLRKLNKKVRDSSLHGNPMLEKFLAEQKKKMTKQKRNSVGVIGSKNLIR